MPTEQQHRDKARHNQEYFDFLKSDVSNEVQKAQRALDRAVALLEEAIADDSPEGLRAAWTTAGGEVRSAASAIGGLETKAGQFLDWVLVGVFYCALHHVDAYLARAFGVHPRSHGGAQGQHPNTRNWYVCQHMASIWPDYKTLYDRCRDVRYNPPLSISASDVARFITKNLANIETYTSK